MRMSRVDHTLSKVDARHSRLLLLLLTFSRLAPCCLCLSPLLVVTTRGTFFHHNRKSSALRMNGNSDHHQELDSTSSNSIAEKQRINQTRRPRIPILRYRSNWVCINKPAGMTVHHNRQQKQHPKVVSTLKRQLGRKVFPVHRLDHRTTGAMLLAFDSETAASLQATLRTSRKLYVALLRGEWDPNQPEIVTIDEPITHNGRTKEARTIFRRLAVWKHGDDPLLASSSNINRSCTLVLVEPLTGRTHQIRRHAARHLRMPVIGDSQHGDSRVNRYWRHAGGEHNLNRLALHCLAIENLKVRKEGRHGSEDEVIAITAPLPDDLRSALQHLKPLWEAAVSLEARLATEWVDERGGTLGKHKNWQQ